MALTAIKNSIIRKTIENPRLGRIADLFGSVMPRYYCAGLSRNAYKLSGVLKEKSVKKLEVHDGKIFGDNKMLLAHDMFNGIERGNIKVTPDMLTTEGMEVALRWDIIGNRTELYAKMVTFIFGGLSVGVSAIFAAVCASLSSFTWTCLSSAFIFYGSMHLPLHRILQVFTGSNDKDIKLTNVEGKTAQIVYFSAKGLSHVSLNDLKGGIARIKINKKDCKFKEGWYETITHEKAHLLKASEYSVFRVLHEKFVKHAFYGIRGWKERLLFLSRDEFDGMVELFFFNSALFHNLAAIYYAWLYLDILRYHRPMNDRGIEELEKYSQWRKKHLDPWISKLGVKIIYEKGEVKNNPNS